MAHKRKQSVKTPRTTSFVVAVLAEAFRRAALAAETRGRRQSEQLRAIHRAALVAVLSGRAAS